MQGRKQLEEKLDAYASSTPVSVRADAGKAAQRTWPVYAAAAASGLAMTTGAGADIIWSGPQSIPPATLPGDVGTVGLKIDIDGKGNSFLLGVNGHTTSFFGGRYGSGFLRGTGKGGGQVLFHQATVANLSNLATGAKISSAAGSFGNAAALQFHQGGFGSGEFAAGVPGFAGVKFTQSTGPNPGVHFGWIQLSWNSKGSGSGFVGSVSVGPLGWAYNSVAGQEILAGQTPEPSSGVMGLLGLGAAGLLAWRRKRKELRAAPVTTEADDGADNGSS